MSSVQRVVQIRKTVGSTPSLPYEEMALAVFGTKFELSLVICGDALAKSMNIRYRQKTYSPNVLSFPYGTYEGEIFLNVRKAEREARSMKISTAKRMALLFVHGCFHLKGLKHGDAMEAQEQKVLAKFKLSQ